MNSLMISPTVGRKLVAADPNALRLLRSKYPDLWPNEFDTFVHTVDHVALDPLRDQIIPMVFHKNVSAKRRLVMVTTINGYRTIADRTGTYAPSSRKPTYVYSKTPKKTGAADRADASDPANPANLVSVTVYLKKFSNGDWHEFPATANWDEYAPLTTDKFWDHELRVEVERKRLNTTGLWPTMPKHMLEKCAFALGCRIGWPDDYGGNLYDPAEIDRMRTIDLAPHEYARVGEQKMVARSRSGPNLEIQWTPNMPAEMVPAGQLLERAAEFIRHHEDDLAAIGLFREYNKRVLSSEYYAFDRAKHHELAKLFLPYEDRYHGRRPTTFASRLKEQKEAPARTYQEFQSGTRRHIRHADGRNEDIDVADDPRWEIIP